MMRCVEATTKNHAPSRIFPFLHSHTSAWCREISFLALSSYFSRTCVMGSCDNMPGVEGNVGGVKKGCDSYVSTTSKFTLMCWECAREGGKYKHRKNNFHRCRTESRHMDVDWRQDRRELDVPPPDDVHHVCTKCALGYEEDFLLCDWYVPPRIVLHKKNTLCPLHFAIPIHHFQFPDMSRDTQM